MQADPKTRKLIRDAIRAALSTAMPTGHDSSEDPEAVSDKKLPAYAVVMTQLDSEFSGMGDDAPLLVTDEITVSIWRSGGKGIRATLDDDANALDGLVQTSTATLSTMVHWVRRTGHEFEIDRGESRIGRVDVTYETLYVAPLAGANPDGFNAGFSGGFRKE